MATTRPQYHNENLKRERKIMRGDLWGLLKVEIRRGEISREKLSAPERETISITSRSTPMLIWLGNSLVNIQFNNPIYIEL